MSEEQFDDDNMDILEGETCPFCLKPTLTLMERASKIAGVGIVHVFGMECQADGCEYGMSDVELEESKGKQKLSIEISSEADMNITVIKSAAATVKIPRMVEMTPGADSIGFVTTIEGLLKRFKDVLEQLKQDDDKTVAKKAKNQYKKLQKVMWGQEAVTITIDDPTGNSAIVSEKVIVK